MLGGVGGVGQLRLLGVERGFDREEEARPEGVGRAHPGAEVHRLADAFGADGKVSAHGGRPCMAGVAEASWLACEAPCRWEERRVGDEGGSTGRIRWAPYH